MTRIFPNIKEINFIGTIIYNRNFQVCTRQLNANIKIQKEIVQNWDTLF